jgi:hypothetical protein NreA
MPTVLRASKQAAAPHSEPAHQSHSAIANRLKRAKGHLEAIVTMIEAHRDCTDIAQQMHAVIRALENAKTVFIHDHIDHCLESTVGPADRKQRATINQFKTITKYL